MFELIVLRNIVQTIGNEQPFVTLYDLQTSGNEQPFAWIMSFTMYIILAIYRCHPIANLYLHHKVSLNLILETHSGSSFMFAMYISSKIMTWYKGKYICFNQ